MTEEWQNQQKTFKILFAEADDDETDDDIDDDITLRVFLSISLNSLYTELIQYFLQ